MKQINQWRNFLMESDIGSVAKLVGFCMAQYYIPNKPTYPSLTTLTIDTQYCKNTVKSGIRDLEKAGFIRIEEKRMGNNSFKSHCYLFIGSTGDIINDTVNEPVIDIANDIANDIAPAIS